MSPVGAFDPDPRDATATVADTGAAPAWAEELYASVSPGQLRRFMAAADLIGRGDTVEEIAGALVDQGIAAIRGARGVVVVLDDAGTHLHVVASSGYDWNLLMRWRRFPLTVDAPLAEAVRTGRLVVVASVEEFMRRYPRTEVVDDRPHALVAVPLFSGSIVIGGWGIHLETGASCDDRQVASAAAAGEYLGGFASSGIARAADRDQLEERVAQLQTALTSRIVIEQAKGILAERHGMTPEDAFHALRRHARSSGQRLHHVAAAVVGGDLDPSV